jgi:hypothetical protein
MGELFRVNLTTVKMTIYVDADHAHDLVTRRSITGTLIMLNNMPILDK